MLHEWTPIAWFKSQRNERRVWGPIAVFWGEYDHQWTLVIRITTIALRLARDSAITIAEFGPSKAQMFPNSMVSAARFLSHLPLAHVMRYNRSLARFDSNVFRDRGGRRCTLGERIAMVSGLAQFPCPTPLTLLKKMGFEQARFRSLWPSVWISPGHSCTRVQDPLSRYTCRATRVVADFLRILVFFQV